MNRRYVLLTLAVVALLAPTAPAAQASDGSVFRAWTRENKGLRTLEKRLDSQLDTWSRSGGKKGGPARETSAKMRQLIARRKNAVAGENASSDAGAQGKSLALANLRTYDAALLKLRSAIRAGMSGNIKKARADLKSYNDLMAKAIRYENRANKAFDESEAFDEEDTT